MGGDTGSSGSNSVSFRLLSLPGSVNQIYEFGYTINSPRPERRLKAEWSVWATKVKPYIPLFRIAENSIIRIDRCYGYPWFYQNRNWRKVDTANMDKLLFDVVSQKIGIDDSMFKCGLMDSVDSADGFVDVVMTEITETEWRANAIRQ
jgi:hypothetical protein